MQNIRRAREGKWRIRFSKEERNAIVLEYLTTGISQVELAEKYGIPTLSSISNWLKKYRMTKDSLSLRQDKQETPDTPMEEKNLTPEEEIASLKAKLKKMEETLAAKDMQLKRTEMQNLALNTILDIAAEQGNDLRKKSGAKQ